MILKTPNPRIFFLNHPRSIAISWMLICLWCFPAIAEENNPIEASENHNPVTSTPFQAPINAEPATSGSQKIEPHLSAQELKTYLKPKKLFLRSHNVLVMDENEDVVLYERRAEQKRPIASITKLMTAMVLLDSGIPLDEPITITRADKDRMRYSKSRLKYGTVLSRADLLLLALASSENRAASALARTFPGGKKAFVKAMNVKSKELGMLKTKFKDPAGLHSGNVSTAKDLVKLINAAYNYPLIRELSTAERGLLYDLKSGKEVGYINTNRLVRGDKWDIDLSKTGFISEAGFCLVMSAEIANRPLTIILLNSWGKLSKYGDANRIKSWLLQSEQNALKHRGDMANVSTIN